MISAWAWMLLILAAGLQCVIGSSSSEDVAVDEEKTSDTEPPPSWKPTDPLLLTPYINQCMYDDAKNLSKVQLFQLYQVTAYSGYITVNSINKSHLFFLFVVAEGNKSDAPFLLWTQGGPGLSALFGQFLQNGPVKFFLPMNLSMRENTLHKTMNLIYLDLPVGAGFSYTETSGGYSKTLEDITMDVTEFLRQFFELFYEYKGRKFYFAGESYGARYSVAIADKLLKDKKDLPLELNGVIGGNGFLGPILETAESSEFLYQSSMLTLEGKMIFAQAFSNMTQLLPKNPGQTLPYLFSTIFADITHTRRTLFQNLTLYNDHASPLHTERPLLMLTCYGFLNDTTMKLAFHAGKDNKFEYSNNELHSNLAMDWLRDIRNLTENVLNGTSVLFYTGQLDALFPSVNQRTYFAKLEWKYAKQYRDSKRCLWNLPSKYGSAGYLKHANTFWEAVVLGMSHYGAVDKPDEAWYLTTQFIQNNLSCPRSTESTLE